MKKRLLFILCLCFISASPAVAQTKTKTVTNADLEKFRQKRLQNERDYRENYEKLNFPSPDDLARQREQRRLENEETIIRRKEERQENENDFAARASALRSEMVSVEAQINYVLSLFPANRPPTSYYTGGAAPFGYARNGQSNSIWSGDATGRAFLGGGRTYTPNPLSSFGNVRQVSMTPYFYGRDRIYGSRETRINIGIGTGRFRDRQYDPRHGGHTQSSGYYAPFVGGGYDYTQDELAAQLRALEQERAGLYAEWRLLQETAKQAGVKID